MFRTHESAIAWKAGWLALLVHVLLLGALIFSFNWKAAHTVVAVSEVELWDSLPNESKPEPPKPKKPTKVIPPKPVEEVEKVEPKVVEPKVEEPKVEAAKPEVDIALEKKKKEEEQKKKEEEQKKKEEEQKKKEEEQKKKEEEQKKKDADKLAEKKRKDDAKAEEKKKLADLQKKVSEESDTKEKIDSEVLARMRAETLSENAKPSAAASQGVVDEYVTKIQAKIRGNVNRSLCSEGNPELKFKVSLMPNGEFSSNPALTKSSGNAACDGAVERAIIASEPFPLPTDPDALARFRNLNLNFKPNAE
ncbi:MAG: cell envelope integrity protein TolA [Betaproteobacteria bacterium]|nr:cell envelope integrity protein TolA [Betaproteobacteria bacterium]